jgi:hypothetical protein
MIQRGRKGSEQVQVADPLLGALKDLTVEERLPPPVTLTDAERHVWLRTVNAMPANFFGPEHIPIMTLYCRHVVQGDFLAEQILTFDEAWLAEPGGIGRYDWLLRMQEREGRAAANMATKLRITKQSVDAKTAGRQVRNANKPLKPWET